MIWFSNRDGMRAAAMSGGAQADVYALFFTRDAYDRFRLTKEEAALLREIEEKKAKAEQAQVVTQTPGPARTQPKSQTEELLGALAKSAAHAIGSQIGRQIIRGVLGSILGGGKR